MGFREGEKRGLQSKIYLLEVWDILCGTLVRKKRDTKNSEDLLNYHNPINLAHLCLSVLIIIEYNNKTDHIYREKQECLKSSIYLWKLIYQSRK